jgi:hypothetical protein
VLIKAAREKDTRRCLLLLGAILDTPGLAERLLEALRPELAASPGPRRNHEHKNLAHATRATNADRRRMR